MRIYIPFTLMVTFNGIVIKRLQKSKKITRGTTTTTQMSNREYKFKLATVIIDFTFLAFYTPMAVNLSFGIVDIINNSISNDPMADVIINVLFANVAQLLAFAYSVIMIFIFVIFNKIFRKEIISLLRLNRIFPSQVLSSN